MKKILALCLTLLMFVCCGCSNEPISPDPVGNNNEEVVNKGYVIAMNPSVMLEDGTVHTLRNEVASSMSADMKEQTTTNLYDTSPWMWLIHGEEGEWSKRLVRSLVKYNIKSNSPYTYKMDDENVSSLAVYDNSKMKIEGCSDGELNASGIIMAFAEGNEHALCFTAEKDGLVQLYDHEGGNIAVVKTVAGQNTSFLERENAKHAIVLRVYKNNRIYWQEYLNSSKTAVVFPMLTKIEMKAGDRLIITAEAVDDTSDITCGNYEIPEVTVETVIEKIPNYTEIPVEKEITEIALVENGLSNFTIIRPASCEESIIALGRELKSGMQQVLGTELDYKTDEKDTEGYEILLYKTKYKESKDALDEIKAARKAYAGDFIIRMVGKKLVIAADNEYSLEAAIDYFLKHYCSSNEAKLDLKLNYVSSKHNSVINLTVAGNRIYDYRIVVSHVASFMERQAASYLAEQIALSSGYALEIVDDGTTVASKEILIGDTNRTSSTYSKLATTASDVSNSFKIRLSGNSISVVGNSTAAVNTGTVKLVEKLLKDKSIDSGFELSGTYDGNYSLTDGYGLTWSDEFNAEKLSKTWSRRSQGGTRISSETGGKVYNNLKYSFLDSGTLVQRVEKRENGIDFDDTTIESQGSEKMNFKYGYVEMRVKLPLVQGIRNAFWMFGDLSGSIGSGEFDIFENFGALDNLKPNLHIWDGDYHANLLGGTDTILNYAPGTTNPEPYGYEYHTIGMQWEDDYIGFYVDGKFTRGFDTTDIKYNRFDKMSYLIINAWAPTTGFGGLGFKNVDDFAYADTYYDWIRIYQKNDGKSVMYVKK